MADVNALYPRPPDPSQGALDPAKVLGMLGQVNALQRFQAEFGAKKAIGDAYTGALQPDGTIDQAKLAGGLKNPAASYGLPDAVTTALGQRGQQLGLDTGGQAAVAGLFAGVDPKTATPETIHSLTARAARNFPSIPPATLNNMARSVLNDPQGLAHGIATMRNLAIGAAGVTAPAVNAANPDTGVMESVPLGEYGYRAAGGQKPSGGVQTGLPLGSERSAAAHQEALLHAGNFGQEILPLDQAIEAADRLKAKYGTGYFAPGSQGRQEFQSFLYGISPGLAKTLGVDPDKLKDFAEAKKYLTQATAARAGGFGAGTEAQLKVAVGGSPNVDINDMAVDQVLNMMKGARRMEHVQTQLASEGGPPTGRADKAPRSGGPVNFAQNAADWATHLDPKAFLFDRMEPKKILEMEKNLKGDERQKFNLSLRSAVSAGAITQEKMAEVKRQVLEEKARQEAREAKK